MEFLTIPLKSSDPFVITATCCGYVIAFSSLLHLIKLALPRIIKLGWWIAILLGVITIALRGEMIQLGAEALHIPEAILYVRSVFIDSQEEIDAHDREGLNALIVDDLNSQQEPFDESARVAIAKTAPR